MKAKLTIIYEKEINATDIEELKEAVNNGDDQYLTEFFEIGWETPIIRKLIIGV